MNKSVEKMDRQADLTSEMNNEELAFINSIDWGAELITEGKKVGLKTAPWVLLLPPLFEDFQMMTNQEIKNGDRVVTQQGGKWGVIIADGTGTWIIKPEYEYIGYPNNLTDVRKYGKWGVLDLAKGSSINNWSVS
jgi:hypothetical protein